MASNDLDWQIGLRKISQRTSKVLDNCQWSDCAFIVGNENKQTIKAHRLILAITSPVFAAMFYGQMADKENKAIEVLDVQPQAFQALLKYIYSEEINFTSLDQVCEICYAAKKYLIPHLVEECTKFIWKDLHPGNVCRAYAFVRLFEEPHLLEQCMRIIKCRTKEVVQDISFEDIDEPTLKTILEQDHLQITELVLWEGIVRWSSEECLRQSLDPCAENQRKVLVNILPYIRFLTMSPNQFANGPAISNILTQEESLGLLMNISSPGVASLPPNFCSSTVCRITLSEQQPQQPVRPSRRSSSFDVDLMEEDPSLAGCYSQMQEDQSLANCAGPLSRTFVNDEIVDCTLSFSVDKNICILGVILPTQLKPHGFQRDHKAGGWVAQINRYSELIYAFLQDSNGSRLTYTHFSARVPWENTMEVIFNKPIDIVPNMTYKIVVALNKMGRYPLYSTVSTVLVDNVNFIFEDVDCDGCKESLVKTLIFKNITQYHYHPINKRRAFPFNVL